MFQRNLFKIFLIPVWLITLSLQPLMPDEHPWKQKKLSLEWWVVGATPATLLFCLFWWAHTMACVVVIWRVW